MEVKMNEVTNTHDLSLMDRFDSNVGIGKIKLSSVGIALIDVNDINVGDEIAVYVAKNGRVILFSAEKGGYKVAKTGRGGFGKAISCRPVIRALESRGITIPQEAELDKDDDGRYCASLSAVR
jgi:hypothetical protein